MNAVTPAQAAWQLNESMLLQIAYGLEPPPDIAERYGIDASTLIMLEAQTWFRDMIETKRAALLAKADDLLTSKFRMMAEDLAVDIYRSAKSNAGGTELMMEAFKHFAKLGMLEPKQAAQTVALPGAGFSISINLPEPSAARTAEGPRNVTPPQAPVIDIKNLGRARAPTTVAAAQTDDVPPKPPGLRVPDFDMSRPMVAAVDEATQQDTRKMWG